MTTALLTRLRAAPAPDPRAVERDVTVRFPHARWHELPYRVQVWIGVLCGPLEPDAEGMLTMVLSEGAWAEIERMIEERITE